MNTRKDRFSKKILETPPSGIRKFFDLIIGRDDIISLGVGEPDFPTPWSIREEAYYHLEKGHTSHTSNRTLLELRETIAEYLSKYGLDKKKKNEILVTIGVSTIDAAAFNENNPSLFDMSQHYGKQLLFASVSVFLGLVIMLIDAKFFNTFAYVIYGLSIILLL